MKKILSFVMLVICHFPILSAMTVGISAEEKVTINVYNWGEYISDGSEGSLDVNKAFEEKYGIKVNYTTYASNEDLYAKLKGLGSTSGYDVIFPSDYMIARMVEEGMLEKIDTSKLSNYQYVDEKYLGLSYDPTNEYSVPYAYGMVGVIYNTTMVDEADTGSWDLLWNEKYSGKILNFMNSRDAFGTAQFYIGKSVNSTSTADWYAAFEKLKEQKPILQGYVMDEIYGKMEGGNAAIAPYYAGDFFTMYENNEDLAFYYPEEGTNSFVDAMCIPKGAPHYEEALLYINFLLSEEISVANAQMHCYASPNKLVLENEEYLEFLEDMHPDARDILYPELSEDYKTEVYLNLSAEMREYEKALWEELMIHGQNNVVIYAIAGIMALIILAMLIYTAIKKKIQSNYSYE